MSDAGYDTHSFVFIASAATLVLVYILIVTEWVNRAVIALLAAAALVTLGVLDQTEAVRAIDFNTVGLLAGMMIMVAVARKSGLFGYVAIRAAQLMRGSPPGILIALALTTAVFSAFLNNVTTVLLVVPVTFVVCGELKVPVYPFLFAEVFASNIGGTATLIGDPPNIMIGSAAHLSFDDFFLNLAPIVAVIMATQLAVNHIIWGAQMRATPEDRAHVMALKADEAIEDRRLLIWSLVIIAVAIAAFVLEDQLHLQAATIAMFAGALMLLIENLPLAHAEHSRNVTSALNEIEWITIFFFLGLFIVVGAVEHSGVLRYLADELLQFTGGNSRLAATAVLWASAILSAIVDNIPFVATMIPLIKSLAPAFGGDQALLPIWWSLALGACLGGNGTLVGASPNLVAAGLAEKAGVEFSFLKFTALAFPMMLASIAICHVYILWRYF
ncbi:MAG TPA: ArsB/NhaD family transporter [Rhizomicrobium sp.]|jgi:Na+/H+ antiporter NhaD/arsenite permease-like protein|nr:ArsB/NhaD family transporter [Rhizomicrobium sp.]